MDLDDDVLYSFIDATSLKNNIPFFFQVLIDALSKPKGIVGDLSLI